MPRLPKSIENLINALSRLPGVGPRTSARFVFYLMSCPQEELENLAQNIKELKNNITTCTICGIFSETSPCKTCANPRRNHELICVIARPQDLEAIEKTQEYDGLYHILNGTINPLQGIGPSALRIKELEQRLKASPPQEIILALNPDMEGETTVLYLTKLLKPYNIKLSRLARGLPVGGELEYADEITISSALKGRKEI
ncbi:recombination protein RecR [Candidatus Falkowbacteria bacterium]|nr:recombination protein RecR [Candidatus Falkowbacteria bacterium]